MIGCLLYAVHEHDISEMYFKMELAIRKEIGDRDGEYRCYSNLGQLYRKNSQFERAAWCYEKGLEIAEETGNTTEQKELLSRLSVVLINDLHQYERGIEYYKKALDIMKETGDTQGEGESYNHLGHAYHALGLQEKSIEILENALEINCAIGDATQTIYSYHNLAKAYKEIGKCKKSAEYYEKAANISEANGQSKNEVCCYLGLGNVYRDMCQYEKSVEYYEKALLIAKERGYTIDIARSYHNLGLVNCDIGLYKKSIEYYKKALQLKSRLEESTDTELEIKCLMNLGMTYTKLGQHEKAIEYLEKGLEISKATGNEKEITEFNRCLISVYTKLRQYEKSMEFLKKVFDHTNENMQRVLICLEMAISQGISQRKCDEAIKYLERALEIMKECECKRNEDVVLLGALSSLDPSGTSDVKFEEVRCHFVESIKNHEHVREDLEDEDKILVDDRNNIQYEVLSCFLVFRKEVDAALCIAERGRARALEDLMCKKYAIQKRNDSHELKLDELSCLFTTQGRNFLFMAIQIENLFSFVTRLSEITVRPDSLEKCNSPAVISQDLLQDLVMTIFKSSFSRQHVECEDRSLSSLCLAEFPALEEQVEETAEHFRRKQEDGQEESDLGDNLCMLYRIIIAPVADLLEGPEIVICPEGHMFRIPFATLMDANGRYLAETFRLRLTPSLTTLKLIYDCPSNYHSQRGALIVGDPRVGCVELNGKVGEFPSLPEARKEVQMIARLLGVSPLMGDQATKQEVLTRIQEVSLVHIAAHGDTERGEIAFAPNRSCHEIPKKEDFVLTMEDIAKVGIRAKLVVLSCCHSGCGKVLKSEGVVGIARAFLGSGARSVLVSLWAINDAATQVFMNTFYKFLLRDKLSASEALHLSMKKMRESPLYSDIVYWAPFVLIGDDVTLDF